MFHRLVRLVSALVISAMLVGLCVTAAEAKKGLPRVTGISKSGESAKYHKLKFKWKAVSGAHYWMRVSTTRGKLSSKKSLRTYRSSGTYTRRLGDHAKFYVQVRAIRHGVKGPWSKAVAAILLLGTTSRMPVS